ncbi:uncharacterized protein B0J16DRAFT_333866 [Fusarium flagelliforme]|uniref:uncharacterized protein n=1 Tax=Fusarium flagelliforme TaxID=2675880 RepID=UPI001E8D282A|nr:uncharacterized protein B0J16DRAFT_333866 [Fusarium flagelliforme]KAH7192870.1 hypothetical protein B0J16DRAFT_333866 [Fusarium flagelliforme]
MLSPAYGQISQSNSWNANQQLTNHFSSTANSTVQVFFFITMAIVRDATRDADHQDWKNQTSADGTINITKTNLTIRLGVNTHDLEFEADGAGFFMPYSGTLNAGTLFYNESAQLDPGNATFKLYVSGLDFYVGIYRDQVDIGNFHFVNIGFVFPPGDVNLNGIII